MQDGSAPSQADRRRKLLKSALGMSGVAAMGYSGAALASFSCAEDGFNAGGFPIGNAQFYLGSSPPDLPKAWAWRKVQVWEYQKGNDRFGAYVLNGNVYYAEVPGWTLPTGTSPNTAAVGVSPVNSTQQTKDGFPKDAWVLGYFHYDGASNGAFPTPANTADVQRTPITGSCLTSLNAGIVSNYKYSGG